MKLTVDKAAVFLVCTASPALRERLRAILRDWARRECVELSLEQADALPERMQPVDLLFLDMDSVGVPERSVVGGGETGLIIISGDAGRVIRSYRWHPAAFLKPDLDARRVAEALNACADRWQQGRFYLESPFRRNSFHLPIGRIRYIEAYRHYCLLNQQSLSVRARFAMGELESVLPAPPFFRCHKSYLVHLDAVEKMSYTTLTLRDDGYCLPVGRTYHEALRRALYEWQGGDAG